MPIEKLFEPLKNQLNLPSCPIQAQDLRARPLLFIRGRDQQNPACPPNQFLIKMPSTLGSQLFPFAFLREQGDL